MPDLLLDQGSKKSSSLSFVLDPPLGKDDCKKIRMMMYNYFMPDYYLTFLFNPLAPGNFTVFV